MKIKIEKWMNQGFVVYKQKGSDWEQWLPEEQYDERGDEYYRYFRTVESAKKAAIREKAKLEKEQSVVLEI